MTGAERMRVARQRRRDGLRCIPLEIRDDEIEALVTAGLLRSDARNDFNAIAAALGKLLDRLPPECWGAAPESPELVNLKLNPSFIAHLATLGWLPPATARDRATIKAGVVGFTQRACTLSVQTPAPFRADRNITGGRPS
jgi:hypothetical protein